MGKMGKLPVAIIGASGYTGEELMRLLLRHPQLQLTLATSRTYSGKQINEIYPHLVEAKNLVFSSPSLEELQSKKEEIFFLALPHGEALSIAEPLLKAGKKVIDLSADFRLKNRDLFSTYYHTEAAPQALLNQAVYGNPELYAQEIQKAKFIACPGCYPTSILLALAPILKKGVISPNEIIINSLSGTSGAGRKAETSLLFAECAESVKPYSIGNHRHIPEIEQELSRIAGKSITVQFTPHLLPIRRGILTSITVKTSLQTQSEIETIYQNFYQDNPFVRILTQTLPEIKHVAYTNRCDIAVRYDSRTGNLLIFSALDNLTKGAAGQALQCLNLMMGWKEAEGLSGGKNEN